MSTLKDFRAECEALGAKWLPGIRIAVQETDYGCVRGVAIEMMDGQRHAVRGRAYGQWHVSPWWKFWRKPVFAAALTPQHAIGALAKWVIERDLSCSAPPILEHNEEPLT